ncbi:MAG: hypothetical protein ABSG87_01435 [Verrucomicrobiota bacterium]|jgi:predicted membrane channel-forming protein YqfA (hemolysin III family)
MTEAQAQKIITCYAPSLLRYESTEAKIRRIRRQFLIYILLGATSLLSALEAISKQRTIDIILSVVLLVLGIFTIGIAFWMRRRLLEACHVISLSQSQIVNQKS